MGKKESPIAASPERYSNLRRNIRYSILNGAFGTMASGIVSTFIPLYMIDAMHASNPLIAMLNSIPALTGLLASLIGVAWVPRLWRFRRFSAANYLLARLSYILLAGIPMAGPTVAAPLAVAINGAGNIPQQLGLLGWQGLMAKLIPSTMRENFFGRRNVLVTMVGLAGTIFTGGILQLFNPRHSGPYQLLFLSAAILGCIEVAFLLRHQEPSTGERPRPLRWNTAANLWKAGPFRRYIALAAFFNFGWQMAWPLFTIYQIKIAHATGLWLGIFTIATQATEIATFRWWGKLAQIQGGLRALGLSGLGMGLTPILTVLSHNLWYLTAVNLASGLFASGMTLLLFTELLHAAPSHTQSGAIALYNVILALVAFLAPECGVYLLPWLGMTGTMLLSTVWRLIASLFFLVPLETIRRHARPISPQARQTNAKFP